MGLKKYGNKRFFFVSALIFGVVLVNLASTYKALGFGFWRDDWLYVWGLEILKDPGFFSNLNIGVSYPLNLARLVLLSKVLDVSPLGWQISNVLFRILASLGGGLMILAITRSKIVAAVASLFLSAGVAGIEPASFLGANNVVFFIIPLSIGFYLWVVSLEKENFKLFAVSALIFAICAKGEVWAYYLIPLMAALWDVLYLLRNRTSKAAKLVSIRLAALFIFLLSISRLPPNANWFERNNGLNKLLSINPLNIRNFLASVGNLLLGSLVYIQESAGVSVFLRHSFFVGLGFLVFWLGLVISYLVRPSQKTAVLIFLSAWTILFYLPNWVFESTLVVGASHRYLAISSVGFYGLIAYALSFSNKRTLFLASAFFIITNIYLANKILGDTSKFRSNTIIQSIVKTMDKSIPPQQEDVIIYYKGDGIIRGYILDWSLGIPFAIERKIADRTKFPIWTGSDETVRKLFCGEKVVVNLVGTGEGYERGGYNISKDHLHAFNVKDSGEVLVFSKEKRDEFNFLKCQ